MAAALAAKRGRKVLVLEKANKIGKKIKNKTIFQVIFKLTPNI